MKQPTSEQIAAIFDKHAPTYDQQIGWFERVVLGDARVWVISQARGRVVEIAVGTGLNLPHYGDDVDHITGIDISPRMLEVAERRARALGLARADLRLGDVQAIDLPDESVDTVVSTYTFCTIPDPGRATAEAFRLLVPGGRFVLAEHGPSTSLLGRAAMRAMQPLAVRFCADHLLRDPVPYLKGAGFVVDEQHRTGRAGITFRILAHKPL
ncbi:class I SAM-dependent methyltransferase [Nocardia sp. NPDC059177]|uniref:class I SAM-dependent methyltransferase n=1 Tax=Nocardia sp. NPDC059177 TaxID=3346759 RepID=UPI0036C0D61E